MKLLFIRHSVPEVHLDAPPQQWGLSTDGINRAKNLASALQDLPLTCFFTSREIKAQQTADILGQIKQIPVFQADNLHEHRRTPHDYFPNRKNFLHAMEVFFQNPQNLTFGLETAQETETRFSQAVDNIITNHPNEQTIGIVSHGTVISLYAAKITGEPPYTIWSQLTMPSYLLIDVNTSKIEVMLTAYGRA
jgi:2,3-bisphosphoglycerate-dependent phosphoglycerate mutase